MRFMTEEQSELLIQSYYRTGSVKPVFIALDTQEIIFNKNNNYIYGKYSTEKTITHVVVDKFHHTISIEESF